MNTENIFYWVACRWSGTLCLGTRAMHESGTHTAEAHLDGSWSLFDHTDLDATTPLHVGRAPTQEEAVREVALVARSYAMTVDPFANGR